MKNRFTPLHRALLAAALMTAANFSAQAQSVGIGTTAPDASAALDVVSSARGVLLPRLTLTQRGLIALPATGLIIYQTDNTPGFYYNSGTGTQPVWERTATAADAVTATNGLTKTGQAIGLGSTLTGATTIAQGGNDFSLTGGRVGINTASPSARLDVNGVMKIEGANHLEFGAGVAGKQNDAGKIGYGTFSGGNNALDIVGAGTAASPVLDRVIRFFAEGGANFTGDIIGANDVIVDGSGSNNGSVGSNTLRFGIANSGGAIGSNRKGTVNLNGLDFYTNFNNRMAIDIDGNVGIGTATPAYKLDVLGNLRVLGSIYTSVGNINADFSGVNDGLVDNSLKFGPLSSSEAIGSKRTAGNNQNGLDFYTASTNRMAITAGGNVGIGTTSPQATMDVVGNAYVPNAPSNASKGGGFIRLTGANTAVAPAFATAKIIDTMPIASGLTV